MKRKTPEEYAFEFMGCLTEARRLEVLASLGSNIWHHVRFAMKLVEIGHSHDWVCYKELMERLYEPKRADLIGRMILEVENLS